MIFFGALRRGQIAIRLLFEEEQQHNSSKEGIMKGVSRGKYSRGGATTEIDAILNFGLAGG